MSATEPRYPALRDKGVHFLEPRFVKHFSLRHLRMGEHGNYIPKMIILERNNSTGTKSPTSLAFLVVEKETLKVLNYFLQLLLQ